MSATGKFGPFAFAVPSHTSVTPLTDVWQHGEQLIREAAPELTLPGLQALYDLPAEGISYNLTIGLTSILDQVSRPVASFDEDEEIEEDDDFEDDDFEDDDFEDDDFEDDDFEDDEFDDDVIDDEIEGDADLDVEDSVTGVAAIQAGPNAASPWYLLREARRVYRLN